MSDECEKTCPLCAGEMDLTDQQLKPCNCGYEICVWCWHHIMDMAEKDEIEGRCPACRTPYDKERIVGMAGKCERLVAEFSMEKKQKSQRPKTRTSEGRKQLSSVRVIQRNLVYVVGLPLNLADEDLLQRKEYFSRYGKVLKVSLSRTSSGSIQQFPNNTCSVYITYSKEEEAVCCIQLVHGFTLEGRLLRACFGTTKYCHAWLRNVPCSNPDCLYLHEIGSQEDSFTKDEIVSAYTRIRVQQITGVANNAQRGSGNILPPPADEYCCNNSTSSAKFSVKIASNNSACTARVSFPSSAGALSALPPAASWGARASSCQLPAGGMACSNGLSKQKADEVRGSLPLSKTVARTNPASSLPCNTSNELLSDKEALARHPKNKSESLQTVKLHRGIDPDNNEPAVVASNNEQSCSLVSEKSKSGAAGMIQEPRSDLPSMSIGEESNCEHSRRIRPSDSHLDNILSPISQGSRRHDIEKLQDEHSTMAAVSKAAASMDTVNASSGKSDSRSDVQTSTVQILASEAEDDFDKQRIRDAIVASPSPFTSSPHSLNMLNHLKGPLLERNESDSTFNFDVDPPLVNIKPAEPTNVNLISGSCGLGGARFLVNGAHRNQMGMLNGETVSTDTQEGLDMGESNIISNILSLDLDSWDDSLTSPQNLVKLLDETDKQCGSVKLSSSHRSRMSNQSRFSFVRHDECSNSVFEIEPSYGDTGQMPNNDSFVENRDPFLNQLGNGFEFTHRNVELFDNISSSQPIFSSSKPSVSRAQISAPPGFSLPNRPPPPGFSSRERSYQTFDIKSGNHLLEPSSFLRDARQASLSENFTVGDIEFIDPAILAVGKGRLPDSVNNPGMDMRPGISSQTSAFGNESKLQLLMQRSISPHQNLTYTHVRDSYSPPNDAYGFTLRHLEQTKTSNLSPLSEFAVQQSRNAMMSNGH